MAVKSDGSVVTWGEKAAAGWPVMPEGLSGVTAIAAGAYHTVVLVSPIVPVIITQPAGQTVKAGQNASFSVTAEMELFQTVQCPFCGSSIVIGIDTTISDI